MLSKKFDLVLLGAGASVDAGVPAARKLAETLIRNLAARHLHNDRSQDAAAYIWAALEANHRRLTIEGRAESQNQCVEPQIAEPDVETLIQAIDRLANRREDVLRPFIGSWDDTLALLEGEAPDQNRAARDVSEEIGRQFAEAARKTAGKVRSDVRQHFRSMSSMSRTSSDFSASAIADAAGDAVAEAMSTLGASVEVGFDRWGGRLNESLGRLAGAGVPRRKGGPLAALRSNLTEALLQEVWLPCDRGHMADYLKPLLEGSTPESPTIIATLNYDNTVEHAAQRSGLEWSYGLVPGLRSVLEALVAQRKPVMLLKLHGSANWRLHRLGSGQHDDVVADNDVEVSSMDATAWSHGGEPALIFGDRQKLSADYPFFDMFLAFRDALQKARSVLVIGYSFRDDHVNSALRAWFSRDDAHNLEIVDPGWGTLEPVVRRALRVSARQRWSGRPNTAKQYLASPD